MISMFALLFLIIVLLLHRLGRAERRIEDLRKFAGQLQGGQIYLSERINEIEDESL